MTIKEAQTLLRLFNGPQGQNIIKGIESGNTDFLRYITDAMDLKSPTADDLNSIKEAANTFKAPEPEPAPKPDIGAITKDLRNIMMRDPKTMAIIAGVNAVGEGSRTVGNIMANNGNRLANAILAARRHNSQAQDNLYGPGWDERNAAAWGEERKRKGETAKFITDAIGNTIDKTLGNYNNADLATRSMVAGQYMSGTPGTLYNWINGMQSRAGKMSGGN